jgi:hypothetical protein
MEAEHRISALGDGRGCHGYAPLLVTACVLGVAGCSSWPLSDSSQSLQLQSTPAGVTATTCMGQSCQTPCSLTVTSDSDFTVTFAQSGYLPRTITVAAREPDNAFQRIIGGSAQFTPNPVSAQLETAPPDSTKKKRKNQKTANVSN